MAKKKRNQKKRNGSHAKAQLGVEHSSSVEESTSSVEESTSSVEESTLLIDKDDAVKKRTNTRSYRVQQNVQSKTQRLKTWYLSLPLLQKILWGSIIIPLLLVLLILNSLILPFLPVIGGILLTIAKFTFIVTKFSAFAVYIGYKVAKTLLMIYYCISRTLSGQVAGKVRVLQSQRKPSVNAEFPSVSVDQQLLHTQLNTRWKRMSIQNDDLQFKHEILFSYLRYAIVGQIILYTSLWKKKAVCWKLWQKEARAECKAILSVVGQSIFTPYSMGPHKNEKRILIPGDAKILGIYAEDSSVVYHIECPWKSWSFQWKSWPLLMSQTHTAEWRMNIEIPTMSLPKDDHGFDANVVHCTDLKQLEDLHDESS